MLKTPINVRGICIYPATHRVASYLERGEAALMGCPIPIIARENVGIQVSLQPSQRP